MVNHLSTHIFAVNKYYLCIVDYHSMFPIIKKRESLLADSLMLACKEIFSEFRLPKRIIQMQV